jgi:mannan endo-1,4-beta-mannosidase
MMKTDVVRIISIGLTCLSLLSQATFAEEVLETFVTRRGDQLFADGKPLRFVSFNIPNLLVIEDAYSFTKPNPWRWPDEFEIEDALESVRQMGGLVVRTYTISVLREGSDMGKTVHVLGPGEFNEEGFRALDKVLEVANRKGIRVLVPLVDNWKWMGGVPQYAAFRGKPEAAFWSDPEIIADFKKTIEYVLNRKNTYTGVRYRDDPAIFGWETGNEIDATADWTREIAAYIRDQDPNHLIVDGRSLHGVEPWQLAEPNTDVITTHHYPHGLSSFVPAIRAARATTKGKKPYVVGEFGFVPTPEIKAVLDTVVMDDVAGTLLWSLRFHRREGGFYWHMEVGTGGNFYKAYHWPGFASGAAYDEREVLALMREKGFEIQNLAVPALVPPAPPRLLPIEHPSVLSWQGSAGAASYDVERAPTADGPWNVVGDNVSDADVQNRPLFSDTSAEPGVAYFYRVTARNAAGASAPSNTAGPVIAANRTLVDECRDWKLLADRSGQATLRTDNVRQVQEDAHRFELGAGATVTYQLDEPISAFRIGIFADQAEAPIEVSGSADGTSFQKLPIERKAFSTGEGDYGYLIPIMIYGVATEEGQRHLRIANPAPKGMQPVQISRVELDYGR